MSDATLTGSDRKRVLIIYSSTHGHTAKIASNLAGTLRSNGMRVDVREVLEGSYVAPGAYDAIVAAASIHRGHHQKEMVEWVREHRRELDARPNAFISVSLTAAEDTEEAIRDHPLHR
jgi:menaquinone-dependent protoporphyrinogen oxidase